MQTITTRRIPFEFPEDIEPYWKADMPEWCAFLNGLSLTMPYLEPFLIRSVREAAESITDERIKADAKSFIEQEAQHFSQHRKFNELLKSKGYEGLANIETEMEVSYKKLNSRSLRHRMAYTSGFETMTLGLTRFLVDKRCWLFKDADPRIASLMLWHIVEEAEHKNVAIDVYRAACPGYLSWAYGLFHGSFHVIFYSIRGASFMLKQDGMWKLKNKLAMARLLESFAVTWFPILARSLLPGHHPSKIPDPDWVGEWVQEYRDNEGIPLLDTHHDQIPARFA